MYTNISFTEKQREDEYKLYDSLKSNGFFDSFYQALNEGGIFVFNLMNREIREVDHEWVDFQNEYYHSRNLLFDHFYCKL